MFLRTTCTRSNIMILGAYSHEKNCDFSYFCRPPQYDTWLDAPAKLPKKLIRWGVGTLTIYLFFSPRAWIQELPPPPPDTHVLSALLFPTLCSPVYSSGDTGLPLEDFFFMATPVDKSYFINMYSYFLNRNVQNYSIIKKI